MKSDYERIAAAIRFIEQNAPDQPTLADIASELGLSTFHFQRLFHRWAGVSPKRFLQFLTVQHAKQLLEQSKSVLDTTYEVGLSGPARLHDHFVSLEAVTPGEYKTRGAGLQIGYGIQPSPFGSMFLATTQRGVCWLSFLADEPAERELASLKRFWRGAEFSPDKEGTAAIAERIFTRRENENGSLTLLVKGTNFQINVWKALLRIPPGLLCSYSQIAHAVGTPSASRAVGRALAVNPVAFLIPCHRVIRKVGTSGDYRWGDIRKKALIGWEAANLIAKLRDRALALRENTC
jgi:AraC family transcriptional regulator of adaptative response/methylated-DNA-[protein]-cysteine methyltransferase